MSVPDEWYTASFCGVTFMAGRARGHGVKWEKATTLMPSVPPAAAAVYTDWLGRLPDTMRLPVLVVNEAQRLALAAVSGYPGGDLITEQGHWTATTFDSMESDRYFMDTPQVCVIEFTLGPLVADAEEPAEEEVPIPVAGFAYSTTGLLVEIDVNQGAWSADGIVDVVNVEWGDGDIATMTGPFNIGAIPSAFHEYGGADTYIVNVSVTRNGVTSADESQSVTVA